MSSSYPTPLCFYLHNFSAYKFGIKAEQQASQKSITTQKYCFAVQTMEAKAGNKGFYSNYLLLNPKQATFFDLFCVLFSSDLRKRKFIDSSYAKLESFWYRLLLFLSATLQKFLLTISTPMAALGSTLEDLLNLLTSNGGLFGLVKNIMKGIIFTSRSLLLLFSL